jgi:hypothetical protein
MTYCFLPGNMKAFQYLSGDPKPSCPLIFV